MVPTTNITLSFPNWVYALFSLGIFALIFYLGFNWKSLKEICKEFPKIRRALDLISAKLFEQGVLQEQVYISSTSPLKLTEVGIQLLQEAHFEEFFEVNKKVLFDAIDKKKPKRPFDVEEDAKDIMMSLDEKVPRFSLIKDYAYNKGKPVGIILQVFAIELRDRYFKEHPEIFKASKE